MATLTPSHLFVEIILGGKLLKAQIDLFFRLIMLCQSMDRYQSSLSPGEFQLHLWKGPDKAQPGRLSKWGRRTSGNRNS